MNEATDAGDSSTAVDGDAAYQRLAAALDRLANGFPRTRSGVELRLLRLMFSAQEAALAAVLTATPEPVGRIAERGGLAGTEAAALLKGLARRGLVWVSSTPGVRGFRLAPFVVGGYESHMLSTRDPEYARLVEEYLRDGGAALIMAPQPAIHRVVPARAAVKSEWVLPYDDVRAILLGAASFRVEDCVCRVQQDALGARRCSFPIEACLAFSSRERPGEEGAVSQAEALELLDRAEEVGLVHTVSNVAQGIGYVCNCCGCCCGLLRGITEWGVADSVAQANYVARIDREACTSCGVCEERCQVGAIGQRAGDCAVDTERCIGCGLCATGCPSEAATLHLRPPGEIVDPPADFAAWERRRLQDRGLI